MNYRLMAGKMVHRGVDGIAETVSWLRDHRFSRRQNISYKFIRKLKLCRNYLLLHSVHLSITHSWLPAQSELAHMGKKYKLQPWILTRGFWQLHINFWTISSVAKVSLVSESNFAAISALIWDFQAWATPLFTIPLASDSSTAAFPLFHSTLSLFIQNFRNIKTQNWKKTLLGSLRILR